MNFRYEEAVHLENEICLLLENQDWHKVLEQTQDLVKILPNNMDDKDHDITLPLFLRRFTAGSVNVYCLNKRIEALQRLKMYQESVDLLSMLVDQDVYLPSHRGHWYERLALNLEQHLKNSEEVNAFNSYRVIVKNSSVKTVLKV